ncbi:vWA domain-containing protein [Halobaculum lipolyticum]|uniref:VWA domain-containing protein n=1 Tax=Halobaculum lipolyticum TaxID=3032001 RepID=A0ABD5WGQ6_9EURY|nr:vWA domain-containing protein [Halobaculum sp. DT31]
MTHDNNPGLFNTSRRQVLAGLGAVGLASAGAGLGTTAYFSDTESFSGNTLQAGRLDLMLDYKATYDGPNGPELIGQAPTAQQLIDQYGQATDGPLTWEQRADVDFACNTEGLINGEAIPVFDLDDVKPGDYGEVTMSFHICDNPAHVYFRGSVYDDLDNGQSEPEALVDDDSTEGELAESIDVRMWYDEDCSNTYDENTGAADVLIVQDISGSMVYDQNGGVISDGQGGTTTKLDVAKTAIEAFGDEVFGNPAQDVEVGLFTFGNEEYIGTGTPESPDIGIELAPTDDETTFESNVANLQAAALGVGGTALGVAVREANDFLQANLRSGATPVMIVLTDGEQFDSVVDELAEANEAKDEGTRIIMVDINDPGDGEPQLLRDMAGTTSTAPGDGDGTDYYQSADGDFATAAIDILDSILATIVVAEGIIFEGTLAEFGDFAAGGLKLDPVPLLGDDVSSELCFRPGTHCVAFEWSVDPSVGNEIQTDSVKFDFDFAAVQCRHNEEPANPYAQA